MHKLSRPRMTTENDINIRGGRSVITFTTCTIHVFLTYTRHPLQELTVPSYVANDIFIAGGAGVAEIAHEDLSLLPPRISQQTPGTDSLSGPSMLMMTGPNYSGKSVFLKQIALIVYMAHIGCWVPADSATIGLTDKILTRISTRETVSKVQSAFMIDLQQISTALSLATNRSLLIIDEFGKGTDSSGKPVRVKENECHVANLLA